MIDVGTEEYLFTIGILLSFIGMLVSIAMSRRDILSVFRSRGFRKAYIGYALIVMALFLAVELSLVKPTQQLFFDDAIYQGGAQALLHSGQAWMCNYGTPVQCFAGQIFHEPVGTSFNIALGFGLFGVSRAVVFNEYILVSALAVLVTFFAAFLLFGRFWHSLFSELLMALSPIILVWAAPTTSDMLMMFYSVVALVAMLLFIRRKRAWTLAFFAFSLAFVAYTKVDAGAYLVLFPLMYLVLDGKSVADSVKSNLRLIRGNLLNTKLLVVALIALLVVLPEVLYVTTIAANDTYGAIGTQIQNTCGTGYMNVTGTINLQNFGANICSNALFWVNAYSSLQTNYPIMQPMLFTLLAVIGLALLAAYRKREWAALSLWFGAIFLIYTAFYAGSVLFGVDWRFMLALIPVTSLLGGYAVGEGIRIARGTRRSSIAAGAVAVIAIAVITYSTLSMAPQLAINPRNITQAQTARFYENFVYSNAQLIPSSCAVFSFDPTLFNINGRTSTQFFNLTGPSTPQYRYYSSTYPCLVIDYGFWCYTTSDMRAQCTNVMREYNTVAIATAKDNASGNLYGLYRITGVNSS